MPSAISLVLAAILFSTHEIFIDKEDTDSDIATCIIVFLTEPFSIGVKTSFWYLFAAYNIKPLLTSCTFHHRDII